MIDEPQALEEEQRRLDEIQRRKRGGGIRWIIAEALPSAQSGHDRGGRARAAFPHGNGNQRRRKRRKTVQLAVIPSAARYGYALTDRALGEVVPFAQQA
jgi:hypothetical protein